jgi:clostripain
MRFKNIKQCLNLIFILLIVMSLFSITSCGLLEEDSNNESEPAAEKHWTIMYYGDGDCDLESQLLADIVEMKNGIVDGQGVNIVVLFDRIDGYSDDVTAFGDNFTDTRLYRITRGKAWRISGSSQFPEITGNSSHEANMGDANTLKKFIKFCKANYPASKYSLILSNHGGGPKKKSSSPSSIVSIDSVSSGIAKSICWDETSGNDFLYTAEISDALTSDESVHLFGLDACFMSSVEFAYQFRYDGSNTGFKAEIMVASAPTETGYGWQYTKILSRLNSIVGDNGEDDLTVGGKELYYDPATMTPAEFGAIIVEEQRDSTITQSDQSLTCLDLSKIQAVKDAVDVLAVSLVGEQAAVEALRGNYPNANLLHYFNKSQESEWRSYPFFDIYNLAVAVNGSASFDITIKNNAVAVRDEVDALVIYSFANSAFTTSFPGDPFVANKSGVHIFFPDGDEPLPSIPADRFWEYQWWYNAIDLTSSIGYGKLRWCIDNKTTATSDVGNWFELLDCWFDGAADSNGYIW